MMEVPDWSGAYQRSNHLRSRATKSTSCSPSTGLKTGSFTALPTPIIREGVADSHSIGIAGGVVPRQSTFALVARSVRVSARR